MAMAFPKMQAFHFHFDPTFIHFLSFQAILNGQGGANGWKA
jgi:hypothetical protein